MKGLVGVILLGLCGVLQAGTPWVVADPYPGDFPMQYKIGEGAFETAPKNPIVLPASDDFTLTLKNSRASCTALIKSGQFMQDQSTCKPILPVQSNTLAFTNTNGIKPPASGMLIYTPKDTANRVVNVTGCKNKLTINTADSIKGLCELDNIPTGSMTLNFEQTSPSNDSCKIVFYDNFVDNNLSTCQGFSYDNVKTVLSFNNKMGIKAVRYSNKVNPAGESTRTITFKNSCKQTLWFNMVSGTAGAAQYVGHDAVGGLKCSIDADGDEHLISDPTKTCPNGTICRFSSFDSSGAADYFCYFEPAKVTNPDSNPLKKNRITAGSSKEVTMPIYADNNIIFSGGASARYGCEKADGSPTHCAMGNCNDDNNSMSCQYTKGTEDGATIAEFTLQRNDKDYYDISIINGAHIPISMYPESSSNFEPYQAGGSPKGYWCTNPGSPNPKGEDDGIRACQWGFDVSTQPEGPLYYVNVAAQENIIKVTDLKTCTSKGDCDSGEYCGISLPWVQNNIGIIQQAFKKGTWNSLPFMCGKLLGVDTAVNLCSQFSLVSELAKGGTPFNCQKSLPEAYPGVPISLMNLYLCNGPTDNCVKGKSSYQQSKKVCCGCSVWSKTFSEQIPYETGACQFNSTCPKKDEKFCNTNQNWNNDVEPKLRFLKRGCPTAYVYQFDDATSTFTCKSKQASKDDYNKLNYVIEFCPGNSSLSVTP